MRTLLALLLALLLCSSCLAVEDSLLDAIQQVESGGKADAVSRAGALGSFQIMPKTWTWIWKDLIKDKTYADPKYAFSPAIARRAAKAYLDWAKKRLDGLGLTSQDCLIASYNCGVGAVKKYKGIPPYKETKDYVKKVNRALESKRHDSNRNSSKTDKARSKKNTMPVRQPSGH